MAKTELFNVVVVPSHGDDFRPRVLEYGVSIEKAQKAVRWYINTYGLRYKENGRHYHALVQIKRIKDPLPDGYFLFTPVNVKEGENEGHADKKD